MEEGGTDYPTADPPDGGIGFKQLAKLGDVLAFVFQHAAHDFARCPLLAFVDGGTCPFFVREGTQPFQGNSPGGGQPEERRLGPLFEPFGVPQV